MIVGIGIMLVILAMAWRVRAEMLAVEVSGLYWHFVDIVWIFRSRCCVLLGAHFTSGAAH
jgi:heme/copper-type cytochrome/quinol oxidase subunit 3